MHIGLVALDGCLASPVAAIVDIVGTAEVVRVAVDSAIAPVELSVVGIRRRVTASNGS